MRYISIDTGKYDTKAAYTGESGKANTIIFQTKFEESDFEVDGKQSFNVQFEGKHYIVGKAASNNSIDTTKAQVLHKICAYTAIHKLVKDHEELVVAIGCPISIFRDNIAKQQYIDFLFPTREIIINVDSVTKSFTVVKVLAFPESSGIIHLNSKIKTNSMVGIVDIGGLNVNCCIYDKGTAIIKYAFTSNLGGQIFNMDLLNVLESKYHTDLKIDTIPKVLTVGELKNIPDSREDIKKCKRNHIEKILKECKQNGWDVNNIDLVFVGGTSKLLRNEIIELVPDAHTFNQPTWCNVEGWLKAIYRDYEPDEVYD